MVTAIVLAAGESRRMGRPKALLPFGRRSVIATVVHSLARCPIEKVLVVAGPHASALDEELRGSGATIVHNPNYRDGMLTSVQAGVRGASPETTWFLIALVDQPMIEPKLVTALIETALKIRGASAATIVIPTFDGRRGHPLLFHASLAPEVLTLSGEIGLRELMQRHPDAILHVPVANDSVLRDIDTPEDYQRELDRLP